MLDKIIEYANYKFMLAAIFKGQDYIIENAKTSERFKKRFYDYSNLICLSEILRGSLGVQVFDNKKINTIRSAMKYYIAKVDSNNKKEVEICKIILLQTYKPFRKSPSDFYIEQYNKRYRNLCDFLNEEIKEQIDKEIIEDSSFLDNLVSYHKKETNNIVGNIQFLHSINTFIDECPELLYEDRIYSYIENIIEENKTYKDDEELQRLNDSLINLFDEIANNDFLLSEQVLMQAYFSNIFNQDINTLINGLRKEPNANEFFDEDGLEILRNFIIENKSTNMFDEVRLNNLRELLIAFNEEGVLSLDELNELKRNLNFNIDSDYERKNKEFYLNILKMYSDELQCMDYNKTKNLVNILISNTANVMIHLLDLSRNTQELDKNDLITYYLNYLINRYPLIRENPIYMDRICNILLYNGYYLGEKSDKDEITIVVNKKLQEKIKQLRK